MDQITDKLWLGSVTDAIDEKALSENKIQAILCVMDGYQEDYFLRGTKYEGFQRTAVPMLDGVPDQEVLIRQALNVANDYLDAGYTTLIHCAAGISRSSSITIGTLMKRMKLSWDEAERYVRERRPMINPAAPLKISVLKVLGAWPYDGSLGQDNSNTVLVGE